MPMFKWPGIDSTVWEMIAIIILILTKLEQSLRLKIMNFSGPALPLVYTLVQRWYTDKGSWEWWWWWWGPGRSHSSGLIVLSVHSDRMKRLGSKVQALTLDISARQTLSRWVVGCSGYKKQRTDVYGRMPYQSLLVKRRHCALSQFKTDHLGFWIVRTVAIGNTLGMCGQIAVSESQISQSTTRSHTSRLPWSPRSKIHL